MTEVQRYRLTPHGELRKIGTLQDQYELIFVLELDPGAPAIVRREGLRVRVSELIGNDIANDQNGQRWSPTRLMRRLAYLASNIVDSRIRSEDPNVQKTIYVTEEEAQELQQIDPARVDTGEWKEVATQIAAEESHIFISCGQRTGSEIQLGRAIVGLVEKLTGRRAYFADTVNSMQGLTSNIFNALHNSAGFIGVMHRRGETGQGAFRGSVWVEQEIAIAAFMVQTLALELPSRAYIETGIQREGVRGFIHLNPVTFESDDEILRDLEQWLPGLAIPGHVSPSKAQEKG